MKTQMVYFFNQKASDMKSLIIPFLKTKFCLWIFFAFCLSGIALAQERITDIHSGGTKLITFLTQYDDKNYIISITPEDVVKFYELHENQEKAFIRQVVIPFAYITRNSLKLVKEKYFVIFSDVQIYNYDFLTNTTRIYPINNPLPPGHGFGVYEKDQESVRFSINSTKYLYYYRENRLETTTESVIEKYGDHLILYNGSEYFYSNNYGQDKRWLFKNSKKIISFIKAYENYALAMDSTGLVLQFHYTGSTDTLFSVSRPIDIGYTQVMQTHDYIIAVTSPSQDSAYFDVYSRSDATFVNSVRLDKGVFIRENLTQQEGTNLLIYDSRYKFTIFDPLTKKTYKHNRVKFDIDDRYFISNNKVLLYKYTGTNYVFTALDISSFDERILYYTKENIYYFKGDNFWFKNGNRFYYNKAGDADDDQITLFSFDEHFNGFTPVDTEFLSSGIESGHKLVKIKDKIYLCTSDLYEIENFSYRKINEKNLLPLILYTDSRYDIENERIIFAEDSGDKKELFVLDSDGLRKILSVDKSFSIKEITTFGNHIFIIDWMNDLFIVDIQHQTMEMLEERIDFVPGLRPMFDNGKFLFYFGREGLTVYDPVNNVKNVLSSDRLFNLYPYFVLNGKTHLVFDDGMYTLDESQNMRLLPASDSYDAFHQGALLQNGLFYYMARYNGRYILYSFDGITSTKIYEGPVLYFASVSENFVVFSVHDMFGTLLESKVYNPETHQLFDAVTKDNVALEQVFKHDNVAVGLFHTYDSLFIVKYTSDFSSYEILHPTYDPFDLNASILGTITNDRVLISTGREFLYMDIDLNVYKLESIIPNNEYRQILLRDSLFYFMAIGNPTGNQVYSFNHEQFTRLTGTRDEVSYSEDIFLYPNPAGEYLHVVDKMNPNNLSSEFNIFNAWGVRIQSGVFITGNNIDIRSLQSGVYWLVCKADSGFKVARFVKK